jgi:hypothetical protein
MHRVGHTDAVNWAPLAEVRFAGKPNLDTQAVMKASAQSAADMVLMGTASTHRVDLSTKVKK